MQPLNTTSRAAKYGGISLCLILIVGFALSLTTQNILNYGKVSLGAIITFIFMLLIFKIFPFAFFLIIAFFPSKLLAQKFEMAFWIVIPSIICLYILFARIVWRGEFLHTYLMDRTDFNILDWWKIESSEWHFNISSIIALIYWLGMTFYRKQ